MSAIQGSGLERFLQFRSLDLMGSMHSTALVQLSNAYLRIGELHSRVYGERQSALYFVGQLSKISGHPKWGHLRCKFPYILSCFYVVTMLLFTVSCGLQDTVLYIVQSHLSRDFYTMLDKFLLSRIINSLMAYSVCLHICVHTYVRIFSV